MEPLPVIYALSDSLGETAEMVARATASQFDSGMVDIIRVPYITSKEQITAAIKGAAGRNCIICHTLVSPHLRQALLEQAQKLGIPTVDIMGPMLTAVEGICRVPPHFKPGLVHKLDQEYYRRVEAIEFAVKYDDGKNPYGLSKADVVLIGVSRTSKTPLSMYLAHKKIKAANVPLVPEISPPEELFEIEVKKIVGLVIDPRQLNEIRRARLEAMGLPDDSSYANRERIEEELTYASAIMHRLHCTVLDVSNKAIEETANRIMEIIGSGRV